MVNVDAKSFELIGAGDKAERGVRAGDGDRTQIWSSKEVAAAIRVY